MLIRISLILAIIAGLAAGALNFVTVKEKITTLQTNLENETTAKQEAMKARDKNKRDLDATAAQLKTTQQTLVTTTSERDEAIKLAADRTKAAEESKRRESEIAERLGNVSAELERYRGSGLTPEQALAAARQMKQQQEEIAGLTAENVKFSDNIRRLNFKLDKLMGSNTPPITLDARVKGEILVSDPKWDFVVVNIGEEQHVLPDTELLVSRNGKLVAKLVVRSVQQGRSIANVMPGWKLGEVMEGDQVIPAHVDES